MLHALYRLPVDPSAGPGPVPAAVGRAVHTQTAALTRYRTLSGQTHPERVSSRWHMHGGQERALSLMTGAQTWSCSGCGAGECRQRGEEGTRQCLFRSQLVGTQLAEGGRAGRGLGRA